MFVPPQSMRFVFLILCAVIFAAGSMACGQYRQYDVPRPQYHQSIRQQFPFYQPHRFQPDPRLHGHGMTDPSNTPSQLENPFANSPGNQPGPKMGSRSNDPRSEVTTNTEPAVEYSLYPRMIAEFEPQRAIVLSVCDLQPHHQHVLKQIVGKSAGHGNILILYNDDQQLKNTVGLLRQSPVDHVSFYRLKLDTVWLRDFGPRIAEVEDGTRTIDFFYYGVRPYDDAFPERWALETDSRLEKVPWTLQGGNLICNGQGLGIATTKIFEDNAVSIGSTTSLPTVNAEGRQFVLEELKKEINLRELVVLEPLHNESTKHVDMFAAFVAPDHVVVAELGPGTHRSNQQILDYNASKLQRIKIGGKPLQVSRIRIPPPQGNSWSTYTNAIFTDRLILLPVMDTDPPTIVQNAISLYRQLLPNHHIATVDISSMKNLQGSLHCLSINLPAAAPLPEGVIDFATAKQIADRTVAAKQLDPEKPQQLNSNYTIDEQLRRIFKSSTQDYLVDAYAVALQGDVVTLLRADNKKTVRVKLTGVCKTDQYWITRNAKKIRENGASVYGAVVARGNR